MIRPSRNHPGYIAFLGHRLSGVALALFLPLHFLALGMAIEGADGLDRFLALADRPLVKLAEWGLVLLLTLHLAFGLRLLLLEFLPWRDIRKRLIALGAASALLVGVIMAIRMAI